MNQLLLQPVIIHILWNNQYEYDKTKLTCQDCQQTFTTKRALVTDCFHDLCKSKVAKKKAQQDIQNTTIKFTKEVQEYMELVSSAIDSLPKKKSSPSPVSTIIENTIKENLC